MTYHHVAACKCASQGIHEDCLANTLARLEQSRSTVNLATEYGSACPEPGCGRPWADHATWFQPAINGACRREQPYPVRAYEKWASPTVKGKYKWSPQATNSFQLRLCGHDGKQFRGAHADDVWATPEWIELDRARKALALIERAASDLKWHQAEPAPVSYEAWVRQMAECIYNIVRDARRTP